MKKLHYVLLTLMLLFTLMSMAQAQSEWTQPLGNASANPYMGEGNSAFLVAGNTIVDAADAANGANDFLVRGNLDGRPGDEIVWTSRIPTLKVTDYNLTYLYANQTWAGSNLKAKTLYDTDGDGKDEVVVVAGHQPADGSGNLLIFGLNADNDALQIEKNISLAKDFTYNYPVCDAGYCYFTDDESNLYRYDIGTESIDATINIGTNSNLPLTYYEVPILADCSPETAGREIVFIGDYDSDDLYDDIAVVPESSFNIGSTTTYSFNYNAQVQTTGTTHQDALIEYVSCIQQGGESYIGVTFRNIGSSPNACGNNPSPDTSNYVVKNHDELWQVHANGTISLILNNTVTGETGVNREEENINHFFLDVNSDGDKDMCMPSFAFYDASGNQDCSGGMRFNTECYDFNGTLIEETTTSSIPDTGNSYGVYPYAWGWLGDYDGDADDEFQIGKYVIDPISDSTTTISVMGDRTIFTIPYEFGSGCINYIYADGGTGDADIRVSYSTSGLCTYPNIVAPGSSGGTLPTITSINYSDTAINYAEEDTIYVDAAASDAESDDIYWAHTCNYGNLSDPVRISQEYMDSGTNMTEISQRFHVPSSYEFSNVYEEDTLIGYVLNLTIVNSTGGELLTDVWRNATSNGSPLTSDNIITHWIPGWDLQGDNDAGLLTAARDSDGFFLWGIFVSHNNSESVNERRKVFRIDNSGNFDILFNSSTIPDRILVDTKLNSNEYRLRIDKDFDGNIDYVSSWYPLLTASNNYQDTYFATYDTAVHDGQSYTDPPIGYPSGTPWLDTLYIEHSSLPEFDEVPSNTESFSCTYGGLGTFEIRTWVTDLDNYGNYSSYESQSISVTYSTTPSSVDCTGFVFPTCTGSCYFYDDFNYNYSISCNGWRGAIQKTPYNQDELRVEKTNMDGLSIFSSADLQGDLPIYSEQYDSFEVNFNFRMMNDKDTSFSLLNNDETDIILYVFFDNLEVKAYSPITGTLKSLGSYSAGQEVNFDAVVDFPTETVSLTVGNETETVAFYDGGVDDFGTWRFTPLNFNTVDFRVDDFMINYGDINDDFDGVIENKTTYTYNPNLFCAINWTSNVTGDRFVPENCEARGYSTNANLIGLCVPRACVADTFSFVYNAATDNILMTIIVVAAFILLAPLVVAGRRR